MWQDHFKSLLNSSNDTTSKASVLDCLKTLVGDIDHFSPNDVKFAIKDLKSGKSSGMDGLSAEHFKFASERLYVLFSLLFNSFLVHGYIPRGIMDSIIIPLVKDSRGNLCDKDNYRPIALCNIASKVLEIVLLERMELYLYTHYNQFGFKKGHNTDMAIFALKEILNFYKNKKSTMFVCFLDASKAFESQQLI